jgi:glycosyltransferase involved in cell wall biosynthesis
MDGGSKDGTRDILQRYDHLIRWYSSKDNGQSDAINKGIAQCHGDIIGWLNSDDLYLPGALQQVFDFFEAHPHIKWVYGKCRIIDKNDREIRKLVTFYKNLISRTFNFKWLLVENYISQPAVFIKKEVLEELGAIDPELHYAMDYDLWLRIGAKYPAGVIRDYLACFRRHEDSKSESDYLRHFKEELHIAGKYHKGRFLLFIHKLNIYKIVFLYRSFRVFGL